MNRKYMGITLIVMLMIPLLAACATSTGVGEIDDATLEASVRGKIAEVKMGEAVDIGVEIDKGVVTLSGQVESAEIRSDIVSKVRGTDGVRSVINKLTIR
jgi:osmotically-inducible protein OsmY